jgi:hypothetical protein
MLLHVFSMDKQHPKSCSIQELYVRHKDRGSIWNPKPYTMHKEEILLLGANPFSCLYLPAI